MRKITFIVAVLLVAAILTGTAYAVAARTYRVGNAYTPGYLKLNGGDGGYVTQKVQVGTTAYDWSWPLGQPADTAIPFMSAAGVLSSSATNFAFDDAANACFLKIGAGTSPGETRLLEGSGGGTNYTGFKAPATLAGNVAYTLPSADGGIYDKLQTNASGTLSWSPSTLFTQNLANFTGTDVNTAQPLFEAARDTVSLAANTTYVVEGAGYVSTAGTTSHTFGLLFGGTATFTASNIIYTCDNSATDVLGAASNFHGATPGTVTVLTPATATATHHHFTFHGTIRTANAGTLIPQYKWSAAPGAAGVSAADTYITLRAIGADTVGSVGGWS